MTSKILNSVAVSLFATSSRASSDVSTHYVEMRNSDGMRSLGSFIYPADTMVVPLSQAAPIPTVIPLFSSSSFTLILQ